MISFLNGYRLWDMKGATVFPGTEDDISTIYIWRDVDSMPLLDNAILEDILLTYPLSRRDSNFLFVYPEEYKDKWHKHIFLPIKNTIYEDNFESVFGQKLESYLRKIDFIFNCHYKTRQNEIMLNYFIRHVQAQKLLISRIKDKSIAEEAKVALQQEFIICDSCRNFVLELAQNSTMAERYLREEWNCRIKLMNALDGEGYTYVDQMKAVYNDCSSQC